MTEGIANYIQVERKRGVTDDKIRQELLSKGWDPVLVNRSLAGASDAGPNASKHLNSSNILLFAGVILVLVAAIIYLGYGWPQLSPLSRFLVIAVPNFLLFLTGSYLAKGEETTVIKNTVHTAGHILLPVSIGVFLYQFGFYPKVDSLLLAISTTIALPVYLYACLYKRQEHGYLLTVLATVAISLFLIADSSLSALASSSYSFAISLILIVTALTAKRRRDTQYLSALMIIAVVLLTFAWSSLVGSLLDKFSLSTDLRALLESLLGGGGLFIAAIGFGRLFVPWQKIELLGQRFMLVFSLIFLFAPLLGGSDGQRLVFAVLALAMAALLMIVGYESKVKLVYWMALAGGVVDLLTLLFTTVDQVTVIVLLFVLGFGGILASIYLAKRGRTKSAGLDQPRMRIGLISDSEAVQLPRESGEAPTLGMILARIFLVLMLYFLLQLTITLVIGSATHSPVPINNY